MLKARRVPNNIYYELFARGVSVVPTSASTEYDYRRLRKHLICPTCPSPNPMSQHWGRWLTCCPQKKVSVDTQIKHAQPKLDIIVAELNFTVRFPRVATGTTWRAVGRCTVDESWAAEFFLHPVNSAEGGWMRHLSGSAILAVTPSIPVQSAATNLFDPARHFKLIPARELVGDSHEG
jgi:hypothetical protein